VPAPACTYLGAGVDPSYSSASASAFTTAGASGASTRNDTPRALHAGAKYSPHERANAAASIGDRCHEGDEVVGRERRRDEGGSERPHLDIEDPLPARQGVSGARRRHRASKRVGAPVM
jgi:hypothetical protein